jgi:RadC-like JAB domain
MKNRSQVRRNGSGVAAASQTKTHQSRAAALPRKLPVDWTERFIAKEYKVVTLRERALPINLQLCDNPKGAADYWRSTVAKNPYLNGDCECLVVLILDARCHVKGHQLISIGTMNTLLIHAREVFRGAIVASAYAIILMHNHPSGDPLPSWEDIKITRDLTRAGELLKIEVMDHVIMGQPSQTRPSGFASLRALGFFNEPDAPVSRGRKMSKREEASILRRARRILKQHKQHDQRRAV